MDKPNRVILSKDDPNYREEISVGVIDVYFKDEVYRLKESEMSILQQIIWEEVKRLPSTQQDVLIHYYQYGESSKDIAKFFSKSKTTILERRQRAVKSLQKRLFNNPVFKEHMAAYLNLTVPINYIEIEEFFKNMF